MKIYLFLFFVYNNLSSTYYYNVIIKNMVDSKSLNYLNRNKFICSYEKPYLYWEV